MKVRIGKTRHLAQPVHRGEIGASCEEPRCNEPFTERSRSVTVINQKGDRQFPRMKLCDLVAKRSKGIDSPIRIDICALEGVNITVPGK